MMLDLRKEKYTYIFIFLGAFLIRLLFFISNYNLPLSGDAISYNDLAMTMLANHAYIDNTSYTSPPGYPFFLSVIYFIFGHHIAIVRIIQMLADAALCVLIYWLSRELFNRSVGLIAAAFWATYILFIKATLNLLTEPLFTFVLFLALVYIHKSKEGFSNFRGAVIGLLCAALSLTRAVVLLFLPFLIIILLFLKYYRDIKPRVLFGKIAIVTLAFLLPISIWTYRNYRVYKTFVPISTQGGYAFYNGYFPKQDKIYGFNVGGKDVEYAMSLKSQTGMSDYLLKKALEFIKDNPVKVLRLEILKLCYFWSFFDWEIIEPGKGRYNFQYGFMLPFIIFGILLLIKDFRKYIILYAPIAYMLIIVLIFFGVPRFRMPVEPYLVIFFAAGIFKFFQLFSRKYIPLTLTVLYGFINTVMYLNSDAAKLFFRGIFAHMGLW